MFSTCSRTGLRYAMRGLSALSVPTVGQCEGQVCGMGDRQDSHAFCIVQTEIINMLWCRELCHRESGYLWVKY